jgi:hypothetical protein
MSNPKYKYTPIKEFNQNGEYNFYGIIYDATFPVFDEKENMYQCTIKVIDLDVNCLTFPINLNENLLNVIIKSADKENLPYIHSIGDIMRVHRGNYVNIF